MVARHREISEKYKALRLQPDPLFDSWTIRTLFNKFTKKGNKTFAYNQVTQAFSNLRYFVRRPSTFELIFQILQAVQVQFTLALKREGRKMIEIPVPIRRTKGEVGAMQTIYRAVTARNDFSLAERVTQELVSLTAGQEHSPTLRNKSLLLYKVFDQRVNMEKRWR